jgi:predicted Ser/Thr protein kinase
VNQKAWISLAWTIAAVAAVLFAFGAVQNFAGPAFELEWNRTTGVVTSVHPGGAADRGGLRAGDRILSIGGTSTATSENPFYAVRPGVPAEVVVERGGRPLLRTVVPSSLGAARARSFALGGTAMLGAVSGWLNFLVNSWMLLLAGFLLAVRPRVASARVAAAELAFWAGGNELLFMSGSGPLLAFLAPPARILLHMTDGLFVAFFFAACLHFTLVFPAPLRRVRRRPALQLVPYALAFPLAAAESVRTLRFFSPAWRARVAAPPIDLIYQLTGPALVIASVVVLGRRLRRETEINGRRRLRLLFLSLLPGLAGFLLVILFDRLGAPVSAVRIADLLQWAGVAAGAGIFTYAIVKHRLFDIRILFRKSLQYALAKGTLLAALAIPAVALAAFVYEHRDESVARLVGGRPGLYLALLGALGAALGFRRRLFDALDRRFFREQFDARRILVDLVSLIRRGTDAPSLLAAALGEIDKALHPRHLSLWTHDGIARAYGRQMARGEDAPAPPLPDRSALVALLSSHDDPLDLETRTGEVFLRRLAGAEREWIAATGAELLVPLPAAGRLAGFLLLSPRLSEEPYGAEERDLLRSLAGQLALAQDYTALKNASPLLATPAPSPAGISSEPGARVCPVCRRCYPADAETCPRDDAALFSHDATPYSIEEKYELRQLLGQGGMGAVYLAVQKRLSRPVAIKVLLAHLLQDREIRGRFEREARIIAQLVHPAIVTVFDFGVLASGNAFLVMEYIEGSTVSALIKREGKLAPARVAAILAPIAQAVDLAHAAGVVHRDLKPDNIMVLADSGAARVPAKVLDFGVARLEKIADDAPETPLHPTRAGMVLGTAAYMAPELFRGAVADARSDQYSLGIVAYEMLSGTLPFPVKGDLGAAALAHTQTAPEPLEELVPHLSPAAAGAVHRALEKDPAARFETVEAFVAELARGISFSDSIPTVRRPL